MWKNIRKNILWGILMFGITLFVPAIVTLSVNGTRVSVGQSSDTQRYVIMKYELGKVKLTVEEFLSFVMAKELSEGISDNKEYLKAKCIMARTQIYRSLGKDLDVDSGYINLSYLTQQQIMEVFEDSYSEKMDFVNEIVKSTYNQKIYYENELIEPLYHLVSNGKTRDAKATYPYIESVDCQDDMHYENYEVTRVFTKNELKESFGDCAVTILNCDKEGYINKIKVGENIYSGETFKEMLKLNSASFVLKENGENVEITTKGIGNGFGMSLHFAAGMADKGKSYQEIIEYFYKNIEIRN